MSKSSLNLLMSMVSASILGYRFYATEQLVRGAPDLTFGGLGDSTAGSSCPESEGRGARDRPLQSACHQFFQALAMHSELEARRVFFSRAQRRVR